MAHGTPDWGHSKQETTFALVDDLAELAARLGSTSVYDRRGNVLWMDDFNEGIEAWEAGTAGTGAAVATSTTLPKYPPNCAKLTGGSDSIRQAYITYRMGLPVLKSIGLKVSVAFPTRFDTFRLFLTYWDGTNWERGLIRLSDTDRKIYYETTDGVDVELDDLVDLVHTNGVYHDLKLAVDFENDKYIRLLFNDTPYDLSEYAIRIDTTALMPHLAAHFYFVSREGENDYCLLDGVILTQNEPSE